MGQGGLAVVRDDDALAGGQRASRAASTSAIVVHTWANAVGTPAEAMTSLAKDLLPSNWAAAADGP